MDRIKLLKIDTRHDDVAARLDELREKLSPRGDVVSEASRQRTIDVFGTPLSPAEVVERICRDVSEQGLPALLDYTKKLDQADVTPATLRVSGEELQRAHEQADPDFLATVRCIRDNIRQFQTAILHQNVEIAPSDGVKLCQRYRPLQRVGVCVPGGAAAYPSTVLMTVVPAQAAGVEQIAIVAPPTATGANNPDVLAVCHELQVKEVYRAGGAQAVAALAYGVEGLPKVDKIVGPGNLFVALAKRRVYGEVDIDSIAGPSEVVVLADQTTRPDCAAADLLAQAEHAPGASVLITWDEKTLQDTEEEVQRQAPQLSRSELTIQSLEAFGALILVRDEDEACEITNQIAPEHLHVAIAGAERLIDRLSTAGAVFVGNYSPVALGDYAAGPSHVLPTSGTARWASGLSANDFLRSHSVISYSKSALEEIAPHVGRMADKEGLTAHRLSVEVRQR